MAQFCKVCNNLLVVITTSDQFTFRCSKCKITEEPNDKDTLRYEDVTGTNLAIFKEILQTAGQDPVNPKVEKICKCGNNRVRQVRLGKEMKLINTCIACNDQWLEGTRETD